MLDRRREQDFERQPQRARPSEPAPPLQVGTLGWASAVGNQAVARLARQTAEADEVPLEAEALTDIDADAAEEPALEDLPEELPE